MKRGLFMTGVMAAALVVGGLVVPALGAPPARKQPSQSADLRGFSGLNSFTPASADPKLAALLARNGLDDSEFRFTPAESRNARSRAITVAVRARSAAASREAQRGGVDVPDVAENIGLKPIAYNLGVAVGWKHFAISGDVAKFDLASQPGSHERADVGVTYSGRRFSGRVVATAERPLAGTPRIVDQQPSYAIELGGSYSIARGVDVTAGVRYKSENFRLDRLSDNRRDSQAVYIGTALRF